MDKFKWFQNKIVSELELKKPLDHHNLAIVTLEYINRFDTFKEMLDASKGKIPAAIKHFETAVTNQHKNALLNKVSRQQSMIDMAERIEFNTSSHIPLSTEMRHLSAAGEFFSDVLKFSFFADQKF